MKINCAIIRDLLPLYTESLCTLESKSAVEEHLRVCAACTTELDEMQQKSKLTPLDAVPMKTLSRKLRQKQRRMITLAIVLVIFFSIIAFHHITDRHYLDYSKNLINVLPTADGSGLVLAPKADVQAVLEVQNFPSPEEVPSYPSPESEGYTEYHVSMYKSRKTFHQNQTHFITLNNDVKTRVYFIAPDKTAVLLYGEKSSDNLIVLPRLALNYYFMFAGAILILIGVIWLLLKILHSTRNIPTS
ncbi:MAG: hypothetical protein GX858_03110, partial [Clostridiales bacterium]|nr:hypothetical protein [Clostridiales bacterium]